MTASGLVGAILYLLGVLAVTGPPAPVFAQAGPPSILSAAPAAADSSPDPVWRHPVDAPIVDFFRPPGNRYGPGNRGLEYGTTRGQRVGAVASGQVVFAGQVGVHKFVVVAHDPALRSTYAYLERIEVAVGETVAAGQRLATAKPGFHLTARQHGVYVDPLLYLGRSWAVRLVSLHPRIHRAGPQ